MDEFASNAALESGEYIGGIWVPVDPMDLLSCESCQ